MLTAIACRYLVPTAYLKCVSSLDFSLRAAWAGHWLLGWAHRLSFKRLTAIVDVMTKNSHSLDHILERKFQL